MKNAPAATLRNRVARRLVPVHDAEAARHAPNLYRSIKTNKQGARGSATTAATGTGAAPDWFGIIGEVHSIPDTGTLAHGSLNRLQRRARTERPFAPVLTPPPTDPGGRASCDAIRSLAFAACDGELTRDEAVAVDRHLVDCHGCQDRIARDAIFVRAIRRAVALDAAPRSLRDRVAQTLQSHAAENAST